MKRLFLLSFLFIVVLSNAQSNLTIFSNDGKQFYAIMNGIKQNSLPKTNVYISGIKNGNYTLKIIFADGVTADVDKNVMITEPSDITTRIVFKKGKGKLQLMSLEPTRGNLTDPSTVVYRSSDSEVYTDAPVVNQTVTTTSTTTTQTNNSANGGINMNVGVSGNGVNQDMNQTTTITNTSSQNSNAGMNMNMNVSDPTNPNGSMGINMNVNVTDPTMNNSNNGGMNMNMNVSDPTNPNGSMGINMNVNVTDPTMNSGTGGINMNIDMSGMGMDMNVNGAGNGTGMNQTSSSSTTTVTTTQTTTTSSSSSSNGTMNMSSSNSGNMGSSSTITNTNSNNGGSITCKNILVDDATFVKDINGLSFDSDKVDLIRGDLQNHCLTANQAYKIVETLTYASDRLDISKFLFDRMIDKDKANVLLPLFTFDSDKMEFKEYTRR
jgi:hypothetical protein